MTLLENIWIIVSISLILIILTIDSKTSIGNSWNNKVSNIFESASDRQNFIQQFSWLLVIVFFLLTVSLSYYN